MTPPSELVTGEECLRPSRCDTARLHAAGASRVAWLRSTEADLGPAIARCLAAWTRLPGIVVEGNSFGRHATPSEIVVLARADGEEIKESARVLLPHARWVVVNRPRGVDPALAPLYARRLVEEFGTREPHILDPASPDDPATSSFVAELRAWARS